MIQSAPLALDSSLVDRYTVNGYVHDLYDGDTVYYHASLGYHQWAVFQVGRLSGIDAPELRGESKAKGEEAKAALWMLIRRYALNRFERIVPGIGYKLKVRSLPAQDKHFDVEAFNEKEKYGRWLVTLIGADDDGQPVDLNQRMIADGFARRYDGGPRG